MPLRRLFAMFGYEGPMERFMQVFHRAKEAVHLGEFLAASREKDHE